MSHDDLLHGDTATVALIGILNLQVIIAPDGDSWVAQAIEIDYAAGGNSPEDAQQRFQHGLNATLQEHLTMFGHLDHFLESQPRVEDWLDLLKSEGGSGWKFSEVSLHEFTPQPWHLFPFARISYLTPEHASR